jgi:nitroreductase
MDVLEAIRGKRAIRQFTDQPLPEEAVRTILDAGRRAQSSKNSQRWQFVAVQNRETLAKLAQCGDFAGHLAGAALGVVLVTPGSEAGSVEWMMFDLGQAAANMQLAAWDLGIGSCIATIYQPDQAKAILGVPGEYHCDVAISFGYPTANEMQRPLWSGGRKPLDEIVHWETW